MSLLSIKNLTVTVAGKKIVDDVSFDIGARKIAAIVGGSGSGKTTIGLSILRLLPSALRISGGQIDFEGQDLLTLPEAQMRALRGKNIGTIFQEPLNAFNPLLTIGAQIDEVLAAHTTLNPQQRREKTLDTLARVQLPDPKRVYAAYAHQLSGGMRQRAMIAQAIVCDPQLLIADEPTSSVDVTLQVKLMDLFRKLTQELNISLLLITHDMGMVSHLADDVVVLSQGKVVETGHTTALMASPKHPYTKQLIEAF